MRGVWHIPAASKGDCRDLNHAAQVALHFMYYNDCRVHQTLRVTPAMQAGLADHVLEIGELVGMID